MKCLITANSGNAIYLQTAAVSKPHANRHIMADDETLEITEEAKKDREEAEQAKALNAVTDNVSSSSQ